MANSRTDKSANQQHKRGKKGNPGGASKKQRQNTQTTALAVRNVQHPAVQGSRPSRHPQGAAGKNGSGSQAARGRNAAAIRAGKAPAVRPAGGNARARSAAAVRTPAAAGEQLRDYSLIFIMLFLIAFGLIMLYSTSSYEAAIDYSDGAYYLKRQAISSAIGLIGMMIVWMIPYHLWQRLSLAIYLFSLLLVVLIIPFGHEVNGAKRWLYIGPVSLQPAEVSKLAVIILTAQVISFYQYHKLQTLKGFFITLVPALFQAVLLYGITRNLSSAIIVVAIAICMVFVACKDYWRFGIMACGVGALVAGALYMVTHQDAENLEFRGMRLLVWLDPAKYADGRGYQTLQALYGIGSGGMIGKGLGQSMQKLGYVPEAQNDMIFSIICEELGMFGAVSIIVLFIILCWRIMVIATNAEDLYGSLIAVGVMSHIAVQVILNIAVVTNTIPNTGVSLPFISYGGSSVLFLLAEIGLVMNISRSIRLKELA